MTTTDLRSRLEVIRGIVEGHRKVEPMFVPDLITYWPRYIALALEEIAGADRALLRSGRFSGEQYPHDLAIASAALSEAEAIITRFERAFGIGGKR